MYHEGSVTLTSWLIMCILFRCGGRTISSNSSSLDCAVTRFGQGLDLKPVQTGSDFLTPCLIYGVFKVAVGYRSFGYPLDGSAALYPAPLRYGTGIDEHVQVTR